MKKLITLTVISFMVAISVSSCKSHEKCPAYGSVDQVKHKSL
jgi:uncharacterized protein YcfL